MNLTKALNTMPLVAILRGITPDEILEVGEVLYDEGFRILEVPLNSPDALESISRLVNVYHDKILIGAGTVLCIEDVTNVKNAGGGLIVSPNCNPDVINQTKHIGLISVPAFVTPSEGFAAIQAGADALKLFPAEAASPPVLKAMKAVLPDDIPILPVGGIGVHNIKDYKDAGASGFGLGGSLYKPGKALSAIRQDAYDLVQSIK